MNARRASFPWEAVALFSVSLWYAVDGRVEVAAIMAVIAGRWVRQWADRS